MRSLILTVAGVALLAATGALAQTNSAPTPTPITSGTPQPGTGLAAAQKSWNVGPLADQKDEKPNPTTPAHQTGAARGPASKSPAPPQ